MTEQEWLEELDDVQMLHYLKGKASDRKLRLYAVACCRVLLWPVLNGPCRAAVEAAERHAEGLAGVAEMAAAGRRADESWDDREGVVIDQEVIHPGRAAQGACERSAWYAAHRASYHAFAVESHDPHSRARLLKTRRPDDKVWGRLVLEVFGNPFRPVAVDPRWLAWNEAAVRHLARAIYDERAFDRLPVLADALEDAGCADAAVLSHCRGPGPHARGCWVVDLLLDKR
jgi:hypothetical protein